MRAARTGRCAGHRDSGRALREVLAIALAVVVAAGGLGAAAEATVDGMVVRIYAIQASGLGIYDCSVQVDAPNRMDVMLTGFAATLAFF